MTKHSRKLDNPSPTMDPPRARVQLYAVGGAPAPLPESYLEETALANEALPTLTPPTEVESEGAAVEEGIAAWLNGKKIAALWSDASNCNSWISIAGTGWKRLYNGKESTLLSMTMLASHAEQTNATVNVRIEADGLVHEIYVW